ncbi:MAG: hypothetical protein AAGA60_33065 [Cyanobacteria bacterium P01_E01_bin.42]
MNRTTIVQVSELVLAAAITTISGVTLTQIQQSTQNLIRVEAELAAIQTDVSELKIHSNQLAIVQRQLAVVQAQNEQLKERLTGLEQSEGEK